MSTPKQWHKAFTRLPAAWRGLNYFRRSVIQDLWRLSAPDCSGRIEVDGDPIRFLVRDLDILDRRDRANAVKAVRALIDEDGLITVEGSVATIHTERQTPVRCSYDARTALVRRTYDVRETPTSVRRTPTKPSESLETGPVEREKRVDREKEGERADLPTSEPPRVINFRRPPGEPPPEALAELQAKPPVDTQTRLRSMAEAAYREAYLQRWCSDPGRLSPDDLDELVRQCISASAYQLQHNGLRYDFKSVLRCAAYSYQFTRKRTPKLSWMLEENRVAEALERGAVENPADFQPVVLEDLHARQAAQ